jgi:hypothetical protein
MAIGRITGSVLKSNLTRNGVDLAFETNLLYLDVTNSRVGIGTSEPTTALQINGTTTTTGLTANGAINIDGTGTSNIDNVIIGANTAAAITGTTIAGTTASLTNTSTGDSILVTTTEDSSSAGPVITLKRNSSSPADADYMGQIKFKGENDADQEVVYAKITGKIQDASDGTEDGIIEFANRKAGSNTITARLRSDSFQLLNDTTLVVRNITYPLADGSAGQFITTDGSGNLSFATVSTNSISQGDSDVTVTDSGTGAVTIAADGSTIITMNATTVLDASSTTNAIRLPNGTTAQRPSGAVGEIRYNSTTDTIEGYTSAGGWAQLGATTTTAENTDDTSAEDATAISTTQGVINQFVTSSFDSAWYLAITRDEINNEVSTAKYSLVHNDTSAFVAESHIVESNSSNSYLSVSADIAGGNARLLGTGGSVVNSVSIYRIAVGDNTSAGTTGNVTTTINTDVDSASEKIDGFALTSARGAKYYISVNNTTTGEVSNTEAIVVHDGSQAYISQYGNVNTGNNDLITLTAEVDSTECVVKASGQAPNCRVTAYRILLADDESASSGDNVNVIGATNVSSSATTVDSFNLATYTGAFYVFTGYNSTEGAASIQEVMVVGNDEAYITQGPVVNTKGTDQLSFTASLSGSTLTVKAASTSGSSTTVNGYRVHMLRGTAGASTADTVLVSTTQTITGAKTFSVAPTFSQGYNESINALTSSSTITVNCSTARVHTVTLGTNTEFNIANLPTGGSVTLIITQDGTGSRTATFGTGDSTTVKFPASSSVLSTGANDIDVVTIFNDGTNLLGNIARNYG